MKETLTYIGIIVVTFLLSFLQSAALSLVWIQEHWVRQALVIVIILLTLFLGTLVFLQKAKNVKKVH